MYDMTGMKGVEYAQRVSNKYEPKIFKPLVTLTTEGENIEMEEFRVADRIVNDQDETPFTDKPGFVKRVVSGIKKWFIGDKIDYRALSQDEETLFEETTPLLEEIDTSENDPALAQLETNAERLVRLEDELDDMRQRLEQDGQEDQSLKIQINKHLEDIKELRLGVKKGFNLLEKISENKKKLIALVSGGAATGILGGIFGAIAEAFKNDPNVKKLIPKSADPKDIINSGIGEIVKSKLEDLKKYFNSKLTDATNPTAKKFWEMMRNITGFIEEHIWWFIALLMGLITYELTAKR
jgi:hypothetical protein